MIGSQVYNSLSKPILPTERQVQRAILGMVRLCFPATIIHHSPNGAHLAGSDIARFKQMGALLGDGMMKGWPDLQVLWAGGVAFIEVKRPKLGKVSPEQLKLHDALRGIGWPVLVATNVDDAYMFLRECGASWSGIDPRQIRMPDAYHAVSGIDPRT